VLCPLILGWKQPRPMRDAMLAASYALLAGLGGLFVFAFEGGICILMAAPLIAGCTFAGAAVGQAIQTWRWGWLRRHGFMASFLIIAPFSVFADRSLPAQEDMRLVTSQVVLRATPAQVWPALFRFQNLPSPDFWLFRSGVAYPVGVKMDGDIRVCQL